MRAYLDKFAFRFNRCKSRHAGKIFLRLKTLGVQDLPAAAKAVRTFGG